jgi:predicted TPR repeat methyltransferase
VTTTAVFVSSGDLIADRRYEHARALAARGDIAGAADLMAQAVERAPGFASAWFALGEIRETLGDVAGASEAYGSALAHDPEDRHGAALMLTLLRGQMPASSEGYVRALFDQYAPGFDASLRDELAYRGPELLRDAIAANAGARRFARMIDLGCGTGLMAEAMRGSYDSAVGIDLSTGMLSQARRKNLYDALLNADMLAALNAEHPASADLIVAADSFCYVGDLAPLCHACGRALARNGMLAFTVEAHDGEGVVLQPSLRYAHSEPHVRSALDQAGLTQAALTYVSTRQDRGAPVPGIVVVAVKA